MRREGFFNSAGFSNDPISAGTAANQVKFKDTLPNVVYNNDKTLDLAQLGSSFDPVLSRQFSPLKNEWKQTTVTTPQVIQMQAACENARNGDQFAHLSSMASSVDTSSRLRCGWLYNTGDYTKGRGALGTINGPIEKNVSGTWMWDLNAAKKKYHTEICNNITNCGDIGASMYNGRCGWCKKAGKAVPVSGGVAAYPFSAKTACPPTRLQNNANKCTEAFVNPSVCTPLPNGALSRDCLLQKLIEVGCNDEGSMYQALRSGSDNDYLSQLKQQQAWSVYQNRSMYPLDETALSTGKMTIANALNNAGFVQATANSDSGSASNYAARDLCFKKGELESYDFCSELTDSTNGPFTLDCLQSAFKVAGGQTTGKAYPSASTSSKWNALGTWAAVKEEINTMRNNTQSSNRVTQENAMINFYGITLQNKQTPLEPPGPDPSTLTATVGEHCERGKGWQWKLPIGRWQAFELRAQLYGAWRYSRDKWFDSNGKQASLQLLDGFPTDASYITVPKGLTAYLSDRTGIPMEVVGPGELNFCNIAGFNDGVLGIVIVATKKK